MLGSPSRRRQGFLLGKFTRMQNRTRKENAQKSAQGRLVLIYAHRDRPFLERSTFIDYLEGAARELRFDFWWDERMSQGSWEEEIRYQLQNANIVICLVSQPFLNSKFITDVEARIVSKRHRKEGLIVIPVMYQPCHWESHKWLAQLDRLPKDDPKRPYLHGRNDQTEVFNAVLKAILTRVKGRETTVREPRSLSTLRRRTDTAFTEEEVVRLVEDSERNANGLVPSIELQGQICQEARSRGASPQSPLSKEDLKKLDEKFLANGRRKSDPKKIRWVLRAHRLHPQGRG